MSSMARQRLLSTTEVAERLEVSRPRVHQLRREYPDFPEPVIEQPRALFWSAAQVRRWAIRHGYPWLEEGEL